MEQWTKARGCVALVVDNEATPDYRKLWVESTKRQSLQMYIAVTGAGNH